MVNEITPFGSYNPMAMAAYQQFLLSQQEQSQQQQRIENPLYGSGYSLLYPNGYPSQDVSQRVSPTVGYDFLGGNRFDNLSIFNNIVFPSKYSNDIFAQQLYASRPWENFPLNNSNGFVC